MQIPFFDAMASARSVLIAGAGGGFDVVSGIPIYLYLRRLGKQVTLANLSFTELALTDCIEVSPGAFCVKSSSRGQPYFPEKFILEWLNAQGEFPDTYAFSNELGVAPLSAAYSSVIERHDVDTLLLVDGGTDSLMFGDESKVGTIVEDACSIIAATNCSVKNSFLAAIGFGVEHHLNHHACLENISALIKDGHYMGAQSLTSDMADGQSYLDLVDYLNEKMALRESIVANSIAGALRGEFGDFHATDRTEGSTQFVSALMGIFWFFRLAGVRSKIQFEKSVGTSQTMHEVAKVFQLYRATTQRRTHRSVTF